MSLSIPPVNHVTSFSNHMDCDSLLPTEQGSANHRSERKMDTYTYFCGFPGNDLERESTVNCMYVYQTEKQ